MGVQGSILGAALGAMVPQKHRASGYGMFQTGFGLFWFLGSALMGILYDVSLWGLVAFSVVIQLLAMPLFARVAPGLLPYPALNAGPLDKIPPTAYIKWVKLHWGIV